MSTETYLNHPDFGLLFRICLVDSDKELFTTLYAQRLFFLAKVDRAAGLLFDPIGRTEARMMMETRLRLLRQTSQYSEFEQLNKVYKRTFQ
ncbi:MAG: PipX family protein [Leptolyngbyaceae cyanobacterium MAG.088]|nr:PipX family protein [Leptolyngbyaceae cyanobacterium MAG.088]